MWQANSRGRFQSMSAFGRSSVEGWEKGGVRGVRRKANKHRRMGRAVRGEGPSSCAGIAWPPPGPPAQALTPFKSGSGGPTFKQAKGPCAPTKSPARAARRDEPGAHPLEIPECRRPGVRRTRWPSTELMPPTSSATPLHPPYSPR